MKLFDILKSFKGGTSNEEQINEEFAKMAKELLYGGHFRVEGNKNIYLEEIEFYYHEDVDGGIKDPIMYHTCDHEKNPNLPYFELGRFNMHNSGVDVTFENGDSEIPYRASFLIRAYRVEDGPKQKNSTFIYNDMFYMGIPMDKHIEIEWVEDAIDESISVQILQGTWRKNVPMYMRNKEGLYKPAETQETGENTFAAYKKRYFKCDRPWRFIKM